MREGDLGLIEKAYSQGKSLGNGTTRLSFLNRLWRAHAVCLESIGLFKSRTIWSACNLISLSA
jgi:hypothetical protein